MARPVTLFTGQWADLPLEDLAARCGGWGFDGLELSCWGDHFDVVEALRDPGYAAGRRALLHTKLFEIYKCIESIKRKSSLEHSMQE